MGAFENQIRENETFESLTELYRQLLERTRVPTTARTWARLVLSGLEPDDKPMNVEVAEFIEKLSI